MTRSGPGFALPLAEFGQARLLLLGRLLAAAGTGATSVCSALYLVRSVGLSPGEVGTGLLVANVVGFAALPLVGRCTDRVGGRAVAIALGVVAAAALPWFAAVDSLVVFAAVEGVVNVALLGMMVGVRTLVAHLFEGRTRVRYQAYSRSATNLGMAVGALVAVVPLQVDTRDAYLTVFHANAVAAAVAVACVWFGPRARGPVPDGRPRRTALADGSYLVITALCGVLVARGSILTTAIPLWIGMDQELPRGLAGVLLAVNTVLCVLLQVRLAGRADTLDGAARSMWRGGYVFVVACLAIGVAPAAPFAAALALLVFGVVTFSVAEMLTSAASWTLSYELADPEAHGRYQATFSLGTGLGGVVGPPLATGVAVGLGLFGWAVAALFFLTCSALAGYLVPWAARRAPSPAPVLAR
ncbi:MFS transporter [Actinophytocola sediminis]